MQSSNSYKKGEIYRYNKDGHSNAKKKKKGLQLSTLLQN